MLRISDIIIDTKLQARDGLDKDLVEDYADPAVIDNLPKIEVFYDGSNYFLVDGFHRLESYKQSGRTDIKSTIIKGSYDDAKLYALSRNAEHGKRRSNKDLARALEICLELPGAWKTDAKVRLNNDWIISTCRLTRRQFMQLTSEIKITLKHKSRVLSTILHSKELSLRKIATITGYSPAQIKSILEESKKKQPQQFKGITSEIKTSLKHNPKKIAAILHSKKDFLKKIAKKINYPEVDLKFILEEVEEKQKETKATQDAVYALQQFYNRTAFLDKLSTEEIKNAFLQLNWQQRKRLIKFSRMIS